GYILSPAPRAHVLSCVFTPGSRTHRGLHSVARCAGSCPFLCLHPRFADSPGATFCRPLRGLMSFLVSSPPVRRLTGGYILSPAPRLLSFLVSSPPVRRLPGGLRSVARCAGSCPFLCLHPRFADSPGATFCRPLRGLMSFLVSSPPVR